VLGPVSRRVEVFVGPFGSGKTEVALNRALALARGPAASVPVTLLDLDVVDPYFRARDARGVLEAAGVRLVAPGPEWDLVDLPLLAAEQLAVAGDGDVVCDAGGESHGALVLRQLAPALRGPARVYLVVNPYRPYMRTAEGIAAVRRDLESAAALPVAGLVANPHLGLATTARVIEEGYAIVRQAALRMTLPIVWTAVAAPLAGAVAVPGEILPLTFHLLPPWEVEVA
jgi:hypothetical protein